MKNMTRRDFMKGMMVGGVAAASAGVLTACGSSSSSESTSSSESSSSESTSSESTSSESTSSESAGTDTFTYPMEAVTLTVTMDSDPYDLSDKDYIAEEDYFWNILKDRTGVTLVNDGPTPESYYFQEEYQLMLISGDLPDLLWGNWVEYSGGPGQAIEDGYIISLSDYEEYMPNLMAYLEENPDIANMVTLDDGTLYCFPFISDVGMQVETGAAIRQDWLDEQGLEAPSTVQEWHDVLAALKEAYNLSAPLTFESRWFFTEYVMSCLSGAYNTTYPFYIMDGEVKFGPLTDEYKEFITEMASWYAEGLIDPDMPTVDKSTVTSKMASGESAITINQLSKMTSAMSSNEGTDFNIIGLPSMVMNDGDTPQMSHYRNTYTGTYSVAVSTSCENIEAACRFLDYAYGEEGNMLYNYGTEGISYNLDSNGDVVFTDAVLNNGSQSASTMRNAYGHYYNWAMVSENYSLQLDEKTQEIQEAWYANMSEYAYPTVTYTDEEQEVLTAYWSDASDYCQEMILKFVIGTENLDNWDTFVETLKSTYHIEEILQARKDAYERYASK